MWVQSASESTRLVSFSGDEIDQAIAFASALRLVRPEWAAREVRVVGRDTVDGRRSIECAGQLIAADSWGYIRTLRVRTRDHGRPLDLGGGNAIIEQLALGKISFQLASKDLESLNTNLKDCIEDELERAVRKCELAQVDDEKSKKRACLGMLKLLEEAAKKIHRCKSQQEAQPFVLLLAPRLKSVPRLARRCAKVEMIDDIFNVPLQMAQGTSDAFLQMHVCEAIFWLDLPTLGRKTNTDVQKVLRSCLQSSNPNVRLAAIISAAHQATIISFVNEEITKEVIQLLAECVANPDSPYLSQVIATCLALMKRKDLNVLDRLKPKTRIIFSELVNYATRSNRRAFLPSLLKSIMKENNRSKKGDLFEAFTFLLCLASGVFSRVEPDRHEERNGQDLYQLDVVGYLKHKLGTFDHGFPVVGEAKAWSNKADVAVVRDLVANSLFLQRLYGKHLGILFALNFTTSAERFAESFGAITNGSFLCVGRKDLINLARNPTILIEYLDKIIPGARAAYIDARTSAS
jgi:hypothetical protein